MMEQRKISITKLVQNTGQIKGLPANPRQWKKAEVDRLAKSILETPELLEARGCIVVGHGGKYVVLGGNMRLTAARAAGLKEVPCIVVPEGMSVDKLKEIVIKDNGAFGSWDFDQLANEWDDLDLTGWGVPAWDTSVLPEEQEAPAPDEGGGTDAETIERKRREFEERIAAGENMEEDEEYQEFVDKFKPKKTTDDCYTPELVYKAVADFVAEEYGLNPVNFVRPFYPGGDYQKETYKQGDVVVDNPPFSILSEIQRFYQSKGVKFFLFAPHLTLFSSSSSSSSSLVIGYSITYANGAKVNTSFVTNLEPDDVQFRSCPKLYKAIKDADEETQKRSIKTLPVYQYPPHVITSTRIAPFSKLGIDFVVRRDECFRISEMDAQKASGKSIFGSGFLLSDAVVERRERAERERPERERPERERPDVWELSAREKAIIAKLK